MKWKKKNNLISTCFVVQTIDEVGSIMTVPTIYLVRPVPDEELHGMPVTQMVGMVCYELPALKIWEFRNVFDAKKFLKAKVQLPVSISKKAI